MTVLLSGRRDGTTHREVALLASLPDLLADRGVVVVISFHSIEDRAVKRSLRRAAKGCICPPAFPACVCGEVPTLESRTTKVTHSRLQVGAVYRQTAEVVKRSGLRSGVAVCLPERECGIQILFSLFGRSSCPAKYSPDAQCHAAQEPVANS